MEAKTKTSYKRRSVLDMSHQEIYQLILLQSEALLRPWGLEWTLGVHVWTLDRVAELFPKETKPLSKLEVLFLPKEPEKIVRTPTIVAEYRLRLQSSAIHVKKLGGKFPEKAIRREFGVETHHAKRKKPQHVSVRGNSAVFFQPSL